ncbi:MAG: hypothetical protein UY51_C0005G0666 [Candidatus Jorgensenbacteria bacterium GW2011_GWB1_49_9]|nr:MAG: hypothetical protein UY51_C0005G0666 [Candidatus Jorgensenbacteria bacterium GW2011_GWB1_49_9]
MKNPFEKPYSREAYDKQEEEARKASEEAQKHPGGIVRETHQDRDLASPVGRRLESSEYQSSVEEERANRAYKKLQQLKERGEKEADALEAEYKRLMQKVEESKQALSAFEKDKLGMHEKVEGVEE